MSGIRRGEQINTGIRNWGVEISPQIFRGGDFEAHRLGGGRAGDASGGVQRAGGLDHAFGRVETDGVGEFWGQGGEG